MNREIKFRGFYHKEKNALYPGVKKWVYGSLIIKFNGKYWIEDINNNNRQYKVIPETVGQYINVPEVNNKDLYSGDICKVHVFTQKLGENMGVCEGEKEFIAELDFSPEAGLFLKANGNDSGPFWAYGGAHEESFEKIGNIYDNKDLLK